MAQRAPLPQSCRGPRALSGFSWTARTLHHGGGGRAGSLYATPPSPPPPPHRVLKDSGAGSATNKCLSRKLSGSKGAKIFFLLCVCTQNTQNFVENCCCWGVGRIRTGCSCPPRALTSAKRTAHCPSRRRTWRAGLSQHRPRWARLNVSCVFGCPRSKTGRYEMMCRPNSDGVTGHWARNARCLKDELGKSLKAVCGTEYS